MTTFDSGVDFFSDDRSDSVTISSISGGGFVTLPPYTLLDVGKIAFPGTSADWTVTSHNDGTASLTTSLPEPVTLTEFVPNTTIGYSPIDFSSNDVRVQSNTVLDFSDKTVFVENSDNANIARLYEAALGRLPDVGGLAGWEVAYNNLPAAAKAGGVYQSLAQTNDGVGMSIATGFLNSTEFQEKYGNLSDAGFITQLYTNVLDRAPETGAVQSWLDAMQHQGYTREMVLVGFAQSAENIANTSHAGWLIQV